ncbi:MAG: LacI family transcriptional regulator [Bifidobacteriaceae bacterium]|jgi:DNA-binding LacI/PurR family transcriptional regulator|nr:LacI family transcriptional regulator [Bifidobacteriaceae bacterium]
MTEPVTLDQVARAAGVSRSTASRVINGGVASAQSIESVNQAVADLGFVPNRAAQTLARQRTDQVAIVTPESPAAMFVDPFIAIAIDAISHRLWRAGLQPQLALTDPADPIATTRRFLHHSNVDGIIVVHFIRDPQLEELLTELELPLVFVGRPPDSTRDFPYVDADNVHGGYIATKHLLDQGRRRVACMGGALVRIAAVDRRAGWLRAHREAGLEPGPYVELDFQAAGATAAAAELLRADPAVDAVFAQSDTLAVATLHAAAAQGRRVPEDLAVVGFDDSAAATRVSPRLTTVAQPIALLSSAGADLMVERLRTGRWGSWPRVFPTELVVRDSA